MTLAGRSAQRACIGQPDADRAAGCDGTNPSRRNPAHSDAHWVGQTADRVLAAMEETRSTWQMWHVHAEAQRHVRTVVAKLTWSLDHDDLPDWEAAVGPATLIIIDEAGMADTLSLDTAVRCASTGAQVFG